MEKPSWNVYIYNIKIIIICHFGENEILRELILYNKLNRWGKKRKKILKTDLHYKSQTDWFYSIVI